MKNTLIITTKYHNSLALVFLLFHTVGILFLFQSCGANSSNIRKTDNVIGAPDIIIDSILLLDFDAFDQDIQGGWQKFYLEGNYLKAALHIDAYLVQNENLEPWQKNLLNFHSGQMYAYLEEKETAINRFTASLDKEGIMLNWNPYVKATIAFLKKDLIHLKQLREELITGPKTPEGAVQNLEVVDRFINHIDSDYKTAYENER